MNFWFLAAAAVSFFTCALHIVLGGREAARPLLATTDLDHVAKYTNYYCWHLVTIVIASLGTAFAFASRPGAGIDLALFACALSLAFALWSVSMVILHRLHPLKFGQWALFLPIAILGVAGIAL